MSFDLRINRRVITKVSAINKGRSDDDGNFVYEWNTWRVDPDNPRGIRRYAAGELVHRREDGIEALAIKILQEYLSVDFGTP